MVFKLLILKNQYIGFSFYSKLIATSYKHLQNKCGEIVLILEKANLFNDS
jgi:hypothetical protein